jgi:hypothetical protein
MDTYLHILMICASILTVTATALIVGAVFRQLLLWLNEWLG